MKYLLIISLLMVVLPLVSAEQAQSRYTMLAQQNLQSFCWEERDWSNNLNEYLHQCLDSLQEGQPFQKRKQTFDILEKKSLSSDYTTEVMDPTTWSDLQLFAGSHGNNMYLGAIVDRATTEFGKVTLLRMLGEPVANCDVLRQRQAIVHELVNNEPLYMQVKKQLETIRNVETTILSCWYKRDPFSQAAQRAYYTFPLLLPLNNHWLTLEIKNRLDHYARICYLSSNAIAASALFLYGIRTLSSSSNGSGMIEGSKRFEGSGGEFGPVLSLLKLVSSAPRFQAVVNIIASVFCAVTAKDSFGLEQDMLFLDECMQTKLYNVAQFIGAVDRTSHLVTDNECITSNLSAIDAFKTFSASAMHSNEEFFALLRSSTFTIPASFISSKGKSMRAYALLHTYRDQFIDSCHALGELDAYVAIATLYKEFQHERVTFSFVEYVQSEQPYLELEDFWNPFVDFRKVIPNSMIFGGDQPLHAVITGPNTGGKSCTLKAVGLCLVLGQSFGIVPAKRARFTPFIKIVTHMNITDDIVTGTSLFKAEVLRAQHVLHSVKNRDPGEFCFIILDELFNGTTPAEGQAASYSFAQNISAYPHVVSFIATHFARMTELARVTNRFKNYKVSIHYKEDRAIGYTFKLEPGVAHQNIAFDILRLEGFDETILEQARAMV